MTLGDIPFDDLFEEPPAAQAGPPTRFGGKLFLVLLDDRDHPSIRGGRSLWGLARPLTYTPAGAAFTITVPAGYVTDLASIPRWGWAVLPPDGPWVKAAVIHDFLYDTNGDGVWKGHVTGDTRPEPYSRAEADGILREAMQDRHVGAVASFMIWIAVRVGGGAGWRAAAARRLAAPITR